MEYKVIIEKGDYALILRGTKNPEYAVVYGLDKENMCWAMTHCYVGFGYGWNLSEQEALSLALDHFRARTEEKYISRLRLAEIATLLKDALVEADEESAREYFDEVLELTQEEKCFLGIEEE